MVRALQDKQTKVHPACVPPLGVRQAEILGDEICHQRSNSLHHLATMPQMRTSRRVNRGTRRTLL